MYSFSRHRIRWCKSIQFDNQSNFIYVMKHHNIWIILNIFKMIQILWCFMKCYKRYDILEYNRQNQSLYDVICNNKPYLNEIIENITKFVYENIIEHTILHLFDGIIIAKNQLIPFLSIELTISDLRIILKIITKQQIDYIIIILVHSILDVF